ncbi:MAG: hypothetical protein ACUVTL_10175 [Thermoproteota archaeon]
MRDAKGKLEGYAIVGRKKDTKEFVILELATYRGALDVAYELIRDVCSIANRKDCFVSAFLQDTSHYARVYDHLSFLRTRRSESSEIIMTYPLMPERLASSVPR